MERTEEICHLHLSDVRDVEGVPCLYINADEDKDLKNPTSARLIPIHPLLIELGFLAFVDQLRKEGKKRLFENLTKKQNGYGQAFSRWWGRYGRQHVSDNPRKSFHSLRASFVTALLNAGVELALVQALDGHSPGGRETGKRYYKDYPMATLKAAIDRLDYGEEEMGELKKLPRLKERGRRGSFNWLPPLPNLDRRSVSTYLQS